MDQKQSPKPSGAVNRSHIDPAHEPKSHGPTHPEYFANRLPGADANPGGKYRGPQPPDTKGNSSGSPMKK